MATHFVRLITSSSHGRQHQNPKSRSHLAGGERGLPQERSTGSGFLRMKLKHAMRTSAGGAAYACPMHPEVVRSQPGKCPKCGMALESRGGS